MADTQNIKAKIDRKVETTSKKAAKTQFGKHFSNEENNESKSKVGFYKDTTVKGEGLKYEKGAGSHRNAVNDIKSKALMQPFNKIDSDISEGDEDAGQEVNAKNRQAIKAVFRENIAPAISSSRIGLDRKQGNLARAKIAQHDFERKSDLENRKEQSKDRIKQKNKNIEQYKKLKENASSSSIDFKGDDKYIKEQKQAIKQEKADLRKEKKEYKKDKKKYQQKAYRDNGLKKFSVGGMFKSAAKGYLPQLDFVDSIKNVITAFKSTFKILGAIGSLFGFVINLLVTISPVLIIVVLLFSAIGFFFDIPGIDSNNYLESTKITSKYESLIKDFADDYFNAPLTNKFNAYQGYDEIVLDNTNPTYIYEQNKLAAFLEAYLGESVNGIMGILTKPQNTMCEHFFNSCFRIQQKYETVEYYEKEWDTITQQYTYEKKYKVVLHLDWIQDKTLDQWIEEQWDKDNQYNDDYDKELAQEQFKNYLDPKGFNQFLSSPFESGSSNVTSQYGCRIDPVNGGFKCNHNGIDYAASMNTPLHAVLDNGTVTEVSYNDLGGNTLCVVYPSGSEQYLVRYVHLAKVNVSVGDTVNKEDVIAFSGNSGSQTTGPHLHLEVYLGDKVDRDKQINPLFIVAN